LNYVMHRGRSDPGRQGALWLSGTLDAALVTEVGARVLTERQRRANTSIKKLYIYIYIYVKLIFPLLK